MCASTTQLKLSEFSNPRQGIFQQLHQGYTASLFQEQEGGASRSRDGLVDME